MLPDADHKDADNKKGLATLRLTRWQRFFRLFPPVTIFFITLILVFGIGFVLFSETVSRMQPPTYLPVTDGVVVLTGGSRRLETGFNLLKQKKALRLLISGVNPDTKREALIAATDDYKLLFDCCVDLGREAINTVSNARESADWVNMRHFKTIYVVTNDYHMPRALVEFRRAMPDVTLIAYPVNTDIIDDESWWKWAEKQHLVLFEYIKYIGTHILGIFNQR